MSETTTENPERIRFAEIAADEDLIGRTGDGGYR